MIELPLEDLAPAPFGGGTAETVAGGVEGSVEAGHEKGVPVVVGDPGGGAGLEEELDDLGSGEAGVVELVGGGYAGGGFGE